MASIRSRVLELYKKMTVKQVIACTFVETLFIIMIGVIVSVVIPEFEVLRMDFVFVIIFVNLFEMISVIKEMYYQNDELYEILYWTKFFVFSVISICYLVTLFEFRQLNEILTYFADFKITSILTMLLIIGVDLTVDKINNIQLEKK